MSSRVSLLTDIIYKNPGIHFCEMIRISGIKNGTLAHYIEKLESDGVIQIHREKKKTRFFSPKINQEEIKIISYLRKETSKNIILSLIKHNGLEFSKIVKKSKKSPSTISQNLSELINSKLLVIKIDDSKKKYFIKNQNFISKLVKKYTF
ncbi:MAG: winged helix-turn-helix transcriptional regulator [Candidatus Nitrosopumilus sp. bin_68KS]